MVKQFCNSDHLTSPPPPQTPSSVFLMLGTNPKVRQSLHTMFALSHRHGDILREGWKNILDCLLTLFKAKLLPESLVEVSEGMLWYTLTFYIYMRGVNHYMYKVKRHKLLPLYTVKWHKSLLFPILYTVSHQQPLN